MNALPPRPAKTLAATLGQTAPVSALVRKARRLGIRSVDEAMALAVARGCRHYGPAVSRQAPHVSRTTLADDELTILLLSGEYPYTPMALRCAAQMARSPGIQPRRLAQLAVRERADRVLSHIARAGLAHDPEGRIFWQTVQENLPSQPDRDEPALPHWTRFVSMPGRHRSRTLAPQWLTPSP